MYYSQQKCTKMSPCKLIKSDKKRRKKTLLILLFCFHFPFFFLFYNHKKIKTSNFFVTLRVTKMWPLSINIWFYAPKTSTVTVKSCQQ